MLSHHYLFVYLLFANQQLKRNRVVRSHYLDSGLHVFATEVVLITEQCLLVVARCREKQRKESSRLQTVNRKLSAVNKLLMEENDRLQKQLCRLVNDNGFMRNKLHKVSFLCMYLVNFLVI